MIFSNIEFFLFFAIVLLLLVVSRKQRYRKTILLLSSYFFYAYWDYRLLSLILISTLVDFLAGKNISRSSDKKTRKYWLILSLTVNLGLLGFFKYFNFFITSANEAFGGLGLNLSTLNIILPVGISFYTFQTLSYTLDIYWNKLKPADDFLDFFLFVAFFPQLVAGPIVRAAEFLPQLKTPIRLTKDNFQIGAQIFIFGLIKKVLIADKIAFFVDNVFLAPQLYNSGTLWLAIIGYAIQIYCDFSGYSDMAIGTAKILGFDLPINFRAPYLSTSVTEFWRRWHISLSTWLRDYLYIPLGGNRKGKLRTYVNLMLTMLLGGLWHGASWNFVFWGGIHGMALSVHKLFSSKITLKSNYLIIAASWLLTLLTVLVSWIFFRSRNFKVSLGYLRDLFVIHGGIGWYYTPLLIILVFVVGAHFIYALKKYKYYRIFDLSTASGSFLLIIALLSLFYLAGTQSDPFIYFQF